MTEQSPEVPYAGPPSFEPSAYVPSAYVPPAYVPPGYEPAGYVPPAYVPPGYTPPGYTPPDYTPPGYGQPASGAPAYGPPAPYGGQAFPAGPYGQPAYPTYPGYPDYVAPAPPIGHRRRTLWIVVAALAAVLVIGGLVYAVTSSNSSSTASVVVPDGPGVAYTYREGHFAARFPELPDIQTLPESIGDLKIEIRVAADANSHTVVEEAAFSAAMPASEESQFLQGAVSSLGAVSGGTVTASQQTTFQGHTARQADYTDPAGDQISVLAFVYSSTRAYVLFAPTGEGYDNLLASFVAIP